MAMKRVAVLTGGGDCPGLNAVIRAVVKIAILDHGLEVIGFEDGFEGLIHNRHLKLGLDDVSGILTQGGTILGTSNTANPYRYLVKDGQDVIYEDVSKTVFKNLRAHQIDALVCIGGDGTLSIAHRLDQAGVKVVGVPKTIDNDVMGTDITFGFDTAVHVATDGVDRLHTTAQSHHRAMILEVMGRRAGWIALHAGLAGGGDIILIPEIPYEIKKVVECIKRRSLKGKRFSIVVVSEGAKPKGGKVVVQRVVKDGSEPVRLGGISFALGKEIEELSGIETRSVVLGHLQRGGSPSPFDRILGTRLGARAMDLIVSGKTGHMVGVKGEELVSVPLSKVAKGMRLVPLNHELIKVGLSLGVSFGI